MPVELRQRERDADQDDHGVDEPADEAQPRGGLGRELAARDRVARAASPRRDERAVEHERDEQRHAATRSPRGSSAARSASPKSRGKIRRTWAARLERQAVLLDAMGTLLAFEDPGAAAARGAARAARGRRRRGRRRARRSARRSPTTARTCTRAATRRRSPRCAPRCAEAMRPALPPPAAGAPGAELTAALLDALAFTAYPDAAPALRALRAAGCALVVVSNWDVSLHERLDGDRARAARRRRGRVRRAGRREARRARSSSARSRSPASAASGAWHVGDSVASRRRGRAAPPASGRSLDRPRRRRPAAPRRRARCIREPGRSCPGWSRAAIPRLRGPMSSVPPPSGPPGPLPSRPELPEGVWRPEPPPPAAVGRAPRWPLWAPFAVDVRRVRRSPASRIALIVGPRASAPTRRQRARRRCSARTFVQDAGADRGGAAARRGWTRRRGRTARAPPHAARARDRLGARRAGSASGSRTGS